MTLLARLRAAFLAPPERSGSREAEPLDGAVAAPPPRVAGAGPHASPPTVALLCRGSDARAAGGALALGLARRARPGAALLAIWTAEDADPAAVRCPGTPAARRLAARLASRGHAASATGRLAVVALPAAPGAAVADTGRATAAAGSVPVVVALAGPRGRRIDELLRRQDHVVVAAAGEDDVVADLAVTGLALDGMPARVVDLGAASTAVRALAAGGVALAGPLRARVEDAIARRP